MLSEFSREERELPWQPNLAKISQPCTHFSCVQDIETLFACGYRSRRWRQPQHYSLVIFTSLQWCSVVLCQLFDPISRTITCTSIKHQRKWGCVGDRSTGPMQTICACCADVITEMGTVVHFAAFPDTWCCKVVFLQLSELKRSVAFIQLRRLNCDKCRNTTLHRFRFHNCYCF